MATISVLLLGPVCVSVSVLLLAIVLAIDIHTHTHTSLKWETGLENKNPPNNNNNDSPRWRSYSSCLACAVGFPTLTLRASCISYVSQLSTEKMSCPASRVLYD